VVFLAEVPGPIFAQLAPGGKIVCCELAFLEGHYLSQFLAQQAKGPPHGDDVDRHEQLVQDQDTCIQGRGGTGIHKPPSLVVACASWQLTARSQFYCPTRQEKSGFKSFPS